MDPRDLRAGNVVSDLNGYYDSQNIVTFNDASRTKFSCVLHHSWSHEGGAGLCLFQTLSSDGGRTWSTLRPVEIPPREPGEPGFAEGFLAVGKHGGGTAERDSDTEATDKELPRQSHDGYQLAIGDNIFLFYGWNRGFHPPDGTKWARTDMQLEEGFWCKRVRVGGSGDLGSKNDDGEALRNCFSPDQPRYLIPVPRTAIDLRNCWHRSFDDGAPNGAANGTPSPDKKRPATKVDLPDNIGAFCCDKPHYLPKLEGGTVLFAFQKTRDGNGESYGSEVFVVRGRNFAQFARSSSDGRAEAAAWRKIQWDVVGRNNNGGHAADHLYGLQTARGLLLGEEPHVVPLDRGSKSRATEKQLLCLWRTELGFLDSALSRDLGETWDHDGEPRPLRYWVDGAHGTSTVDHGTNGVAGGEAAPLEETDSPADGDSFDPGLNDSLRLPTSDIAESQPAEIFHRNLDNYLNCQQYQKQILDDHSIIRNPRGAITPFLLRDGRHCVLLHYNNGRTDRLGYTGRRLYWLSVGRIVADRSGGATTSSYGTGAGRESSRGTLSPRAVGAHDMDRSSQTSRAAGQTPPLVPSSVNELMDRYGRRSSPARYFPTDSPPPRSTSAEQKLTIAWSQPELVLFWNEVSLEDRTYTNPDGEEEWNEDWAIVDGPGYADFQELATDFEVILVASNKLMVRLHKIDRKVVEGMIARLGWELGDGDSSWEEGNKASRGPPTRTPAVVPPAVVALQPVFAWEDDSSSAGETQTRREDARFRTCVLPDLRCGAGFTLAFRMDLAGLLPPLGGDHLQTLVDATTEVSKALDEPGLDTTRKGYKLVADATSLKLELTDGFATFAYGLEFHHLRRNRQFYRLDSTPTSPSLLTVVYVFDGGPRVCYAVVNGKIYNPAPEGWRFVPRGLGEYGGADVAIIDGGVVLNKMAVFDRALTVAEAGWVASGWEERRTNGSANGGIGRVHRQLLTQHREEGRGQDFGRRGGGAAPMTNGGAHDNEGGGARANHGGAERSASDGEWWAEGGIASWGRADTTHSRSCSARLEQDREWVVSGLDRLRSSNERAGRTVRELSFG